MKVKLEVGPDSDIKVETDEDGNPLSIEFTPAFAKKNGQAVLAYGVSKTDGGRAIDRFALVVSGSTGKVNKVGRSEPVRAAVDDDQPADKPA